MSHRLMRIATLVVAGWTIAFSGPTALGQPKPKPLDHDFWKTNRWHGSASCTVTARSPSNSDYTNQEIHKWELTPPTLMISQQFQPYICYWAKWTVIGQGSNADFSWTIGSGLLNIAESESAPSDPVGITVNRRKTARSRRCQSPSGIFQSLLPTQAPSIPFKQPKPAVAAAASPLFCDVEVSLPSHTMR
jgi:hypothetical protein